jgi:acyl-CoA thioester hydrolase
MISPHQQVIRLVDCDIFGHVNNAIYLTYFEEARITYFKKLLGESWNWNENGFIVKKNEIEYVNPLFHWNKIEIEITLSKIGNSSFELNYTIKDLNKNEVTTTGKSILVYYNHIINQKKSLDKEITNALLKLNP